MSLPIINLNHSPSFPKKPKNICIIGAGSIVRDAHLPAYKTAGFRVHGITDLNQDKAMALARQFDIEEVYDDLDQMIKHTPDDTVYDLALPASQFSKVLSSLPDHSSVLIQKPMGENLQKAEEILNICRDKHLNAAVNFQLRFAPYIMMAKDAIQKGLIGELVDIEVRVNIETPWHLWDFLKDVRAAEIYYHSIHYVDLIRSFLGNPSSIQCRSLSSHTAPQLDCTRSSYFLDYGPKIRVTIHTNHGHNFGRRHQESFIKFEGTKGAIKAQMGLLLDYPKGESDWFEIYTPSGCMTPTWHSLPVIGSWFPHAFIGSMSELMYKHENPTAPLPHSVEDVYYTMKAMDAAEKSALSGGNPIS